MSGEPTAVSIRSTSSAPPVDVEPTAVAARDAVLGALAGVWDPELGIDVVSLGLVYDVRVTADGVEIDMTLTTPGRPVSEQLPVEAEAAARNALPDVDVRVRVVWDPPWTPDRMSSDAAAGLGLGRRR